MAIPRHEIRVTVDKRFAGLIDPALLDGAARRVLEAECVPKAELGIVITDDETVRRLNREYAGEDEATDVLSFSLREGEAFVAPDDIARLGEVIISYSTAEWQAREAGHPVAAEIERLLVHGVLHLLGYDHSAPADARAMRARESELLGRPH